MEDRPGVELLASFIRDFTDHAIVLLDLEGRILTWNAGARTILGYAASEIVGRYFVELEKRSTSPGNAYVPLSDTLEDTRQVRTSQLVHKHGSGVKVQIVSNPVRDRDNRLAGYGLFMSSLGVTGVAAHGDDRLVSNVVALPGKPKVLLVDDDNLVREQVGEQLADLGYEVASAASGAEALEILVQAPDVDLLFSDVIMPNGMGGRELADKARRLRPDLKVLFSSGYFRGALVEKGELDVDVECLAKPYRMSQLAEKLDKVLRSGA